MEQFTNNAATTLNNGGSVNNSSDPVTFTVTSASGFPSTGNFRVLIGGEILKVTSVSGNNFTAARAQEGTSIATHADGLPVTHVLTKQALLNLMSDFNLTGTFASLPSAGILGRRYQCTDCPFWYYDNGTTWDKFFGSYPIVTPDNTGFSWDNQGSLVLTTTKDSLTFSGSLSSGVGLRYKTAPSAPWVAEIAWLLNPSIREGWIIGLGVRESSTGKCITFIYENNSNTLAVSTWKFTNTTTFSASYVDRAKGATIPSQPIFMKIENDNTNLIFSVSSDGVNWGTFDTRAKTDFLTPDQIALVYSGAGSTASVIHQKGW